MDTASPATNSNAVGNHACNNVVYGDEFMANVARPIALPPSAELGDSPQVMIISRGA